MVDVSDDGDVADISPSCGAFDRRGAGHASVSISSGGKSRDSRGTTPVYAGAPGTAGNGLLRRHPATRPTAPRETRKRVSPVQVRPDLREEGDVGGQPGGSGERRPARPAQR